MNLIIASILILLLPSLCFAEGEKRLCWAGESNVAFMFYDYVYKKLGYNPTASQIAAAEPSFAFPYTNVNNYAPYYSPYAATIFRQWKTYSQPLSPCCDGTQYTNNYCGDLDFNGDGDKDDTCERPIPVGSYVFNRRWSIKKCVERYSPSYIVLQFGGNDVFMLGQRVIPNIGGVSCDIPNPDDYSSLATNSPWLNQNNQGDADLFIADYTNFILGIYQEFGIKPLVVWYFPWTPTGRRVDGEGLVNIIFGDPNNESIVGVYQNGFGYWGNGQKVLCTQCTMRGARNSCSTMHGNPSTGYCNHITYGWGNYCAKCPGGEYDFGCSQVGNANLRYIAEKVSEWCRQQGFPFINANKYFAMVYPSNLNMELFVTQFVYDGVHANGRYEDYVALLNMMFEEKIGRVKVYTESIDIL